MSLCMFFTERKDIIKENVFMKGCVKQRVVENCVINPFTKLLRVFVLSVVGVHPGAVDVVTE